MLLFIVSVKILGILLKQLSLWNKTGVACCSARGIAMDR